MLLYFVYLTIGWSVFALLYQILLSKETFFEANRWYLLGTLLIGLAGPAFQMNLPFFEKLPDAGRQMTKLPEIVVGLQSALPTQFHWDTWLMSIWLTGVTTQLFRIIWGLHKIWKIANSAQKQEREGKFIYFYTDKVLLPFSFFNWIFLNPGIGTDPEKAVMLAHEKAHSRGYHTVDVLICELLCAIFWWNPLIYWYKNALRAVHEFIADRETAQQFSVKQYGLLLIQHTQSGPVFALANHFFQSSLKQRIVMLTRNTSSPIQACKYGLILPTLVLFMVCTHPNISSAQQNADNNNENIHSAIAPTDPTYPGGFDALFQYLANHLQYPESARKGKVEGTVVISFIVNTKGNVENAVVKEKVHPDIDAEALRLISSTTWIAGDTDAELCIPIKFELK